MRIQQQVKTNRPADEVWRFLADVPAVVGCIPGAQLTERIGDDQFRGTFNLKVGPLSAKIEGEGRLTRNDATRSGSIEGKGADRRGGSRVGATMSYRVSDTPAGAVVDVTADLALAGPLSQIGRTGLIEDVAKRLTEDFSEALRARLASPSAAEPEIPDRGNSAPPASFDAGRALRESMWKRVCSWLSKLFGRRDAD